MGLYVATAVFFKSQIFKVPEGHIYIPIADKDDTVTYYLICKKNEKKSFRRCFVRSETPYIIYELYD